MKDALGHGSDARGGGSYPNIDKNTRGPGQHTGYANGPWRIQKSNGPQSNWYQAVHQQTGDVITGKGLGAISAGLASREKLATGNVSPQGATNTMHTGHVVSGSQDSVYHGSQTPHVVKDSSVKGATHALVRDDGKVVGRLYKKGSPAWR